MKVKGPIITLAAGVVVATVLMVLNLSVTPSPPATDNAAADAGAGQVAPTTPAATPTATAAAPAVTTAPPTGKQVTYAGGIGAGNATLAIAIKDGTAVAYLCDGKSTEAWLQGTASGGTLDLTGASEAKLTGTYGNGKASGTVSAGGRSWAFSLKTVAPPSGLYRATANVRNATVVGGWIMLENGEQVGLVNYGGTRIVAPLNPATNTATVDGVAVTATPVDGTGL
jgi:serine/threonine-protein kinase